MQTVPKEIREFILSFQDKTDYRLVCKSWSESLNPSYISSTCSQKIKTMPLTPFMLSIVAKLPENIRHRAIIAINNPAVISLPYSDEILEHIVSFDSDNFVGTLFYGMDNYRKEELERKNPNIGPFLMMIIDLLVAGSINCLVSFSKFFLPEGFNHYLKSAVDYLRSGTTVGGNVFFFSFEIVSVSRHFPFISPSYDEIWGMLDFEKLTENQIEDLLYCFEHADDQEMSDLDNAMSHARYEAEETDYCVFNHDMIWGIYRKREEQREKEKKEQQEEKKKREWIRKQQEEKKEKGKKEVRKGKGARQIWIPVHK